MRCDRSLYAFERPRSLLFERNRRTWAGKEIRRSRGSLQPRWSCKVSKKISFLYVLLPHELPQLNFLYQQKVEQSAEKKGVPPQDFVDEVSVNFRELLDLLNISNDQFIRTTDSNHKEAVQVRSTVYINQLGVLDPLGY